MSDSWGFLNLLLLPWLAWIKEDGFDNWLVLAVSTTVIR